MSSGSSATAASATHAATRSAQRFSMRWTPRGASERSERDAATRTAVPRRLAALSSATNSPARSSRDCVCHERRQRAAGRARVALSGGDRRGSRCVTATLLVAEPGARSTARCARRRMSTRCADVAAASRCGPRDVDEDEPAQFLDGVARIHEYLRAGDVFQVNLSREWRARCADAPAPAALYAALRARESGAVRRPAATATDWAVASSSPERLVEVRGELAQTRPIAGTRPRCGGDDDAARMRELVGHPKERAEHVMLIDLERNDLGRVCVPGTRRGRRADERSRAMRTCTTSSRNVRGRLRAGTRRPATVDRARCFRAARSPDARRCAAWRSSPSSKASGAARTPARSAI